LRKDLPEKKADIKRIVAKIDVYLNFFGSHPFFKPPDPKPVGLLKIIHGAI
jgi:hypothetical protein